MCVLFSGLYTDLYDDFDFFRNVGLQQASAGYRPATGMLWNFAGAPGQPWRAGKLGSPPAILTAAKRIFPDEHFGAMHSTPQ